MTTIYCIRHGIDPKSAMYETAHRIAERLSRRVGDSGDSAFYDRTLAALLAETTEDDRQRYKFSVGSYEFDEA